MSPVLLFLPLLLLRAADLRRPHQPGPGTPEDPRRDQAPSPRAEGPRRLPRGAKDRDPDGFFTTPRAEPRTRPVGNGSRPGDARPRAPGGSYLAYGVMLLALLLFAAGVVGNLALMCIVWHNVYLKSAWNCVLAGVAFWDFLVLFFCLPVVVFHELTASRLLGDASCRLVPYLEVTSLGVATFSLCALSIDRFHAATGPGALQAPRVEPCRSILSKLSVIWTGSMVLAAPELLLWQLVRETVGMTTLPADLQPAASLMASFTSRADVFVIDVCVRQPSEDLPENIYALVLTYHEARVWWFFGCYLCLPLLFTLACDLVTRQVLAQRVPQSPDGAKVAGRRAPSASSLSMKKKQHVREQRLRTTVVALTVVYVTCNLPENICNIALAYVSVPALPPLVLPVVVLVGEFLRFARCAATPVLLLCLCRSLGQAFMDCCCCCCEECLPDTNSSSSSSASTAATSTSPSTLSSPTSPSPSSLLPCPREDRMKSEPAVSCDTQSSAAIGTPC